MSIVIYANGWVRIYRFRKSLQNSGGRYYWMTPASYLRLALWLTRNRANAVHWNQPEQTRYGKARYYEFDNQYSL